MSIHTMKSVEERIAENVVIAKDYNENKKNTYFICQFKDHEFNPDSLRLYNFRLYLMDSTSQDYFILANTNNRLRDGYYLCKFDQANVNYNNGGLIIKVHPIKYLFKEMTNDIRSYKSWIFIYKSRYMFDKREFTINLSGYNEGNVFKYYATELKHKYANESYLDAVVRLFVEHKTDLLTLHKLLSVDVIDEIADQILEYLSTNHSLSCLDDYPVTKRRINKVARNNPNFINKASIRDYIVRMLGVYKQFKLSEVNPDVSKDYGIMEKVEEAGIYYMNLNKKK